jgi:hypothetical protein
LKIASKSTSSSTKPIDQEQVVQSKIQHEEAKFANLGKPDVPVSQTGWFDFDIREASSLDKDDCSNSSSNNNDDASDDDDSDDEDQDAQNGTHLEEVNKLLMHEFEKLMSKHRKLQ